MNSAKVFGVGLSKTGTTSLTRALESLGYRTNHFPFFALRYRGTGLQMDFRKIDRWDACTDSPIALFFRELDQAFPGSKFILTVRDLEAWLRSCERNHTWPGNYVRNRAVRHLPLVRRILALHGQVFGSECFDRDSFTKAYYDHLAAVTHYFADRPDDFMIMDICNGDAWEKLCAFLGREVPQEEFPIRNVGRYKRLKHDSRRWFWQSLAKIPGRAQVPSPAVERKVVNL